MKRFLKAFVPPGVVIVPMSLFAIVAILSPTVDSGSAGATLFVAVAASVAALVFFLPTTIAGLREAPSYMGILIVNTVGGLFLIGWIAALIWAFVDRQPVPVVVQNIYHGHAPNAPNSNLLAATHPVATHPPMKKLRQIVEMSKQFRNQQPG